MHYSQLWAVKPGFCEGQNSYSQLLHTYKWSKKPQYHAGLASGPLNQQPWKSSAKQMDLSAKHWLEAQPTTLALWPQCKNDVISHIDTMFLEVFIHCSRPSDTSAKLLRTLGKQLKVIIIVGSCAPVAQHWRGVLRTSAQKMASLTCGPNATLKNSRRWQTMPPLPGSTINYPRCQTLCSGRPCGRLHKAVSGPCQGYRKFLQDDFPPGHGETSELWKPSKHLPAVTAAQQLSFSQPWHLSTDVCGAFSFSPSLQAKLPPVSCASQNDLPHDILLCVSASLWVAAPPLPGSIVFLSWLEWVLYSSCWGCLTEFCNLFLQAIVFLYSEKRVITWKGVPI